VFSVSRLSANPTFEGWDGLLWAGAGNVAIIWNSLPHSGLRRVVLPVTARWSCNGRQYTSVAEAVTSPYLEAITMRILSNILRLPIALLMLLLMLMPMGQAQADELVTPKPPQGRGARAELKPQSEYKFVQQHLLPKLNRQLERVMPVHTLEQDNLTFRQSSMFAWMERSAASRAESGTRKALRNYLLEDTGIARVVESIRVGSRGVGGSAADSAVDFGVRFSHGQAQAEVRYRANGGVLRVGLGGDGSSSIEFRPSYRDARLHAAYEAGTNRYRLECRYRF